MEQFLGLLDQDSGGAIVDLHFAHLFAGVESWQRGGRIGKLSFALAVNSVLGTPKYNRTAETQQEDTETNPVQYSSQPGQREWLQHAGIIQPAPATLQIIRACFRIQPWAWARGSESRLQAPRCEDRLKAGLQTEFPNTLQAVMRRIRRSCRM